MKVIIAGSRDINDYRLINRAIELSGFKVTEIVSGGCRGVDMLAELFAKNHYIKLTEFPADWNKHGKSAGPIRNRKMAEYADALITIWDGRSKGTANMIKEARRLDLDVYTLNLSKCEFSSIHF